jgi:hypothetical protein
LRSSNNPLPDLVVSLKGPDYQPIKVELAGRVDSKGGGIRNTFDVVPDAPVTKFTLQMRGGKKSLIVNSRNLCKGKRAKATVRMTGQTERLITFGPGEPRLKGGEGGKGAKADVLSNDYGGSATLSPVAGSNPAAVSQMTFTGGERSPLGITTGAGLSGNGDANTRCS